MGASIMTFQPLTKEDIGVATWNAAWDAAWERDEELNSQWASGMEAAAKRIKNVIDKYKEKFNNESS